MATLTEDEKRVHAAYERASDDAPHLKFGYRIINGIVHISVMNRAVTRVAKRQLLPGLDPLEYLGHYKQIREELISGPNTKKPESEGEESGERSSEEVSGDRTVSGRKGDADVGSDGVPQDGHIHEGSK